MDIKKFFFKDKINLVIEWEDFGFKAALLSESNLYLKVDKMWIKSITAVSAQKKEEELLNFLKENLSHLPLENIKTTFILPQRAGVFKRLLIPPVPIQDTESALKLALTQETNWLPENTLCLWRRLDKQIDDKGEQKIDVSLAAFEKNKIKEIHLLCKKVGLRCYGVYPSLFSLSAGLNVEEETTAVLDIKDSYTCLMFFDKGVPLFIREIPFSDNIVTKTLCDCFKANKLTPEDAQLIKRNSGVKGDGGKLIKGVESRAVSSALRSSLERLITEIKRSFDYYTLEFGDLDIENIYLTGEGSDLKGLDEQVSKEVGLPVKKKDFRKLGIKIKDKQDSKDTFSFLPAFRGAALRPEFNVLPSEYRISKIKEIEKPLFKVLIPVISLVLILLFLSVSYKVNLYQKRLNKVNKELNSLKGVVSKSLDIKNRESFFYNVKKRYIPTVWVLKSIAANLPHQTALDSINIDYSQNQVRLSGYSNIVTSVEEKLAGFSQDLTGTHLFKEVNLLWIRKASGQNKVRFKMVCKLRNF